MILRSNGSTKNKHSSNLTRSILLNVDTGSTLNIISNVLVNNKLRVPIKENTVINVKQTKGILHLNKTCTLNLKVGDIVRPVKFFILNTDLPYAILGLKSCIVFQLVVDCVTRVVRQGQKSLITFSDSARADSSLHIFPESNVKDRKEIIAKNETVKENKEKINIKESKNGKNRKKLNIEDKINTSENKVNMAENRIKTKINPLELADVSEAVSGNGCIHYQNHVEKISGVPEVETFHEFKELLENYSDIFAKDKYDVGAIRIEPQRVRLTSDLLVSLRAYKTSPKQQEEIDNQIQELLKANIIKESYAIVNI